MEKEKVRVIPSSPSKIQEFPHDTELFTLIQQEELRQKDTIDLIASENFCSKQVMKATGSVLTNKYAEGYPEARYYEGCEFVDKVEQLAIDRAKKLFGCEYVNVQPHSGSSANMAVYAALLEPGDMIMGMCLADGGHLTHGHKVNFSGKFYSVIQYSLNPETGLLDYDAIEKLALEHKPKLIIAGASAYSRTIDFERFGQIAKKVGAYFMADIAHIAGLVATGLHPNPFPHADVATSTTHKTLRGARGGIVLTNNPQIAQAVDKKIMPGTQGGPLMHAIAGKAAAFFEALQPEFKEYQKQIIKNAHCFATELQKRDYTIVSDGTDNHLFIVDLRNKGLNGEQASKALAKARIILSKSCIPNDPQKPWIGSGVRIGTPAITTQGLKEEQVTQLVSWFDQVIQNFEDDNLLKKINSDVLALCRQFAECS